MLFCPYMFNFPVVKVCLRPKPPTWNLGCINSKVLLVGPWPWAPHQKMNTITFKSLQSIQGFTRGTLHQKSLFAIAIETYGILKISKNTMDVDE